MSVGVSIPVPPTRGRLLTEIGIVLGLSLGMSALYSIVTLINRATHETPIGQQTATIVLSRDRREHGQRTGNQPPREQPRCARRDGRLHQLEDRLPPRPAERRQHLLEPFRATAVRNDTPAVSRWDVVPLAIGAGLALAFLVDLAVLLTA